MATIYIQAPSLVTTSGLNAIFGAGSMPGALVTTSKLNVTFYTGASTVYDELITTSKLSWSWYLEPIEQSWVWTSKVGSMDFTEGLDNEVTKQPMSWYGYIYKILKCSVGAVVYGQNGITAMAPVGMIWGRKDIHPIGIKGQNAVVATKRGHYAIDKMGRLVHVADNGQVEVTDYSNHFSQLSASVVMSYDEAKDVVYIADGTYGYVLTAWGLGKGPINITGMGNKSGTLYSIAPAAVTFDALSIITDVMDLGTRTEKTITEVQIGTYAAQAVQVAIDYRWNKGVAFYTTPWVTADREGRAFITASGVEFRVRVKLAAYEAVQVDYISVSGMADMVGNS